MENEKVEVGGRERFRRLPARVRPDEVVPVKPIERVTDPAPVGTETEWLIRAGGGQ